MSSLNTVLSPEMANFKSQQSQLPIGALHLQAQQRQMMDQGAKSHMSQALNPLGAGIENI